jgi:hypothetical protein
LENQQVPIYWPKTADSNSEPKLYGFADHEVVRANAQHFDLVETRRAKRIRRAYLRGLSAHSVPLLPQDYGQCKEQMLPSGHVCYALGGIEGSE